MIQPSSLHHHLGSIFIFYSTDWACSHFHINHSPMTDRLPYNQAVLVIYARKCTERLQTLLKQQLALHEMPWKE